MESSVCAVIPAFGRVALTRSVVTSLLSELSGSAVLVVDNGGDYEPVDDERVERQNANLGWLGATNLGTELALAAGARSVLWLNNDVELSPGFVAGLQQAAAASGAALVAPCYDDVAVASQYRDWTGPASSYRPCAVEQEVSDVDGTAVLVAAGTLRRVGHLDRRFRRHGWGAIDDLCLRARRAGGSVVVTERAFLRHARGTSARAANPHYERLALAEMWLAMTVKYGPRWTRHFPEVAFSRDGDRLWVARDLAHLARSRLRRGRS